MDDSAKRQKWQTLLSKAKTAYQDERDKMQTRVGYYKGAHVTKDVNGNTSAKKALNVRNITYELVESQVESSIPAPKVQAIHEEDKDLAKQIEAMLLNEVKRLRLAEMNDLQERTVIIQGGDYWHVEWDPKGGTHCTMGELVITDRHPRQIIPQPGIFDTERMDYMFVLISQSKKAIKRRYGVDVENEGETDADIRGDDGAVSDELVTQNIAYYRNDHGGIGMFSWVGDQTLEDLEDYQARRSKKCKKCGAKMVGETCPRCGSKKFVEVADEFEDIYEDIKLSEDDVIPGRIHGEDVPVINPDGSPQLDDETGEPIYMPGPMMPNHIPAYKPKAYPIILRRNVRADGQLLGSSDVDVIEDQQDAINKYGTKIQEKLMKGGSYVTLPQGVNIETTDRELKVIRLKNPAEKALISVLNIQPDTSRDQQMLETNYEWARSALGITNAYQGKYDSSATSGTAKQFSANQAAGRLQSKREMKVQAFSHLYKLMFQFMLAYAENSVPITYQGADGEQEFSHFDRYAFLKRDAAGELYWNDEFIIEADASSNLSNNHQRDWDERAVLFQAGAFGPPQDINTLIRLWQLLSDQRYPDAKGVLASLREQQEEMNNAMPQMPGGDAGAIPPEGWE